MSLEILNTTKKTIEVPKYNYNGKIKLLSGQRYPIEDYMRNFYKPWATVGISIRESVEIEPEVAKVINPTTEDTITPVEVEPMKLESEDINTVEESDDTQKDSMEPAITSSVYTKEDLQFKKMRELKNIASTMGVEVPDDMTRKSDVIDTILNSQKSEIE